MKPPILLRAGEITAVELTGAVLDRILAVDNDIKAYLTLTPELALEQAAEADAALAAARQSRHVGRPAPADRDPAGDQGRDHGGGRAADRRIEDPGRLRAAVQRDRGGETACGRRGDPWQDQYRRVRHGLQHREFGLLHDPQPVGSEPRAGRIERRQRGGGGGGRMPGRVRVGHGRQRAPAGLLLRRRGGEAHLWPRQPLWAGRVRILSRPDRALRQRRNRRSHPARRHRRPRPPRQHQRGLARAGLP